jgi:hypothetical protein
MFFCLEGKDLDKEFYYGPVILFSDNVETERYGCLLRIRGGVSPRQQ